MINLASYYVAAVPVALLLAFPGSQGVEGLYAGLCIGPAIQVQSIACTITAECTSGDEVCMAQHPITSRL